MNKIVSASEFKAKCLRLIDEMQADGVPITITRRGKPVAEMKPTREAPRQSLFGCMKGTFVINGDIVESPLDPDWESEWEKSWDELGYTAPSSAR